MARDRLMAVLEATDELGTPVDSLERIDANAIAAQIASRSDATVIAPRKLMVDAGDGRNVRIVVSPKGAKFYGTLWSSRQRDRAR